MSFRDFLKARRGAKDFREQLKSEPAAVVFYSEDRASYVHFSGVVQALLERQVPICYLTSDLTDPNLERDDANFYCFYIGEGLVRTSLFVAIDTPVVVMTMPDLHSMHLKRSATGDVHYAYLYHSIVSTHLIYREDAFDHYDSILMVGSHHEKEIRLREQQQQLPEKQLVEVGYGRLDAMRQSLGDDYAAMSNADGPILIAPSWGDTCILETMGEELCSVLLQAGLSVVIRPHPMTVKRNPELIQNLEARFDGQNLTIETDVRSFESMARCQAMISDWSGVAFEYAFTFERPVLFIDTQKKTRNPNWEKIPSEPVEIGYRDKIGAVIAPDKIEQIPSLLSGFANQPAETLNKIKSAREELVYNLGNSAAAAADHLQQLLTNRPK